MPKSSRSIYEFPAPKSYVPPEHSGETWDQVCTFKSGSKDGHICLTRLGEHDMDEGEQTVNEATKKPDYKDMSTSIVNYMKDEQN